jgi:hypothetical protein
MNEQGTRRKGEHNNKKERERTSRSAPHFGNVLSRIGTLVAIVRRTQFELGQQLAAHALFALKLRHRMTASKLEAVFGQKVVVTVVFELTGSEQEALPSARVRVNAGRRRRRQGNKSNKRQELHRGCGSLFCQNE